MKSDIFWGDSVHSSLCDSDPLENGKGACFYFLFEVTATDQSHDLGVITSMDVMTSRAIVMIMLMVSSVSVMVVVVYHMMMLMTVLVMVMISRCSLVAVMSTYQKAPTCDAISFAALEAAGWQIDW